MRESNLGQEGGSHHASRELSRPWGEFGGWCHQEIRVGGRAGADHFLDTWLGNSSPVSADWGNFGQQSVPSVLSHRGCNRKPENFRFADGAHPSLGSATNLV